MKVLFLCACALYAVVGQDVNTMKGMPKYDSRYDYLDVDAILDSRRLVRNYVECLINKQRCTPEGKALKRILPEALRTKCVRCTERQKKTAVKVIKRLKEEYPEEWAKLASRWDPTGDFTRYFEEFLAKDNFNTIYGNEIPESTSPTAPPVPSVETSTSPRPVILNRFGDEGEVMMGSPSSAAFTPCPTKRPATAPAPAPTPAPAPATPPPAPATPPPAPATPPPAPATPPPAPATPPPAPATPPPAPRPVTTPPSMRPVFIYRPTQMTWLGSASDEMPSRFPQRPFLSPTYTTAITIIDQIGYKIMRTTELVTDILKNTVRAVVGR